MKIKEIIATSSNTTVRSVTFMKAGLESEVARVVLENNSSVIVKYAKPNRRPNYILEADAYRRLGSLGARVPEVLYADENSLVMSVLPGAELDDQKDLYDKSELFADIAKDLALCWKVDYDGFGLIDLHTYRQTGTIRGSYTTWADFLNQIGEMLAKLSNTGYLEAKVIQKLQDYWSENKSAVTLSQGKLVHGDFAMSAIFAQGGEYSGLIDFGDALIGDPIMDLAYFKFKEINKSYGKATYDNLARPYLETAGVEASRHYDERLNLYMMYWGALRVLHCPEPELRPKFAAKLAVVAAGL